MTKNQKDPDEKSLIEATTDIISETGNSLDGIPAPFKKGFLQACKQLCTAWVEGKAIEIRSTSEAKAHLRMQTAEKIAEAGEVPQEYIDLAMEKNAKKIAGKRLNLDKILFRAKEILEESDVSNKENEQTELNPDWLNSYEDIAENMSSEEMQERFAKILAGEIKKPSSFSIKSVKTLAEIDTNTASLFAELCNCCVALKIPSKTGFDKIVEARLVAIGGNIGNNSMAEFGFSYKQLQRLQEYGLISSDLNSYTDYSCTVVAPEEKKVNLPFSYQNSYYCFRQKKNNERQLKEYRVNGVLLTTVGQELFNLVELTQNVQHFAALKDHFLKEKLLIEPVNFITDH